MSSEHFHKNIKAFIINDLNNSTDHVSHEVWAEAVLRVTPTQLKAWSSAIRTQNWFEDPDIRPQIDAYCDVGHETERYEPFCKIANKVLKLALDGLENVPKTYPLEDITFVRNDPVYLCRNSDLDARRKPDVLEKRNIPSRSNSLAQIRNECNFGNRPHKPTLSITSNGSLHPLLRNVSDTSFSSEPLFEIPK